jgi:hypothetical protein
MIVFLLGWFSISIVTALILGRILSINNDKH